MTRALGYLANSAVLSQSGGFDIPAEWMGQEVSSVGLARLAHSEMARMRANVARTPAERMAVNWGAVVTDVNAGIQEDWDLVSDCYNSDVQFCDEALIYRMSPGWQMQNNWIGGMADQSGNYQTWINTPTSDKQPFIIVTPDTRWPQGLDEETQRANPGERSVLWGAGPEDQRVWARPKEEPGAGRITASGTSPSSPSRPSNRAASRWSRCVR